MVAPDARAAGEVAADLVAAVVQASPHPRIGLATGATMVGVYGALVERCRDGSLSFARTTAYLLDDYVGLDDRHPQAFRNVIRVSLADHVDLPTEALVAPNPNASDLDGEARRYEEVVGSAHLDLQILGIGGNGHIAFNEPGSPLDSATRVVTLSEATRRANARFFDSVDDVPRQAITQGIGTILRAEQILLIALGPHKAAAVRDALEGPVTPEIPASALQTHPDVRVMLDPEAAAMLSQGTPLG
ncbi:glucosamine-6-phosphate deaminase [Candidatus Poriferisocius sp.]|uniref:glucosamine-6-phosphate deaminase n=1 Tax=Candidatus Poriferisocius sp. TaxID=3101276 RepID=UPI003B5BB163